MHTATNVETGYRLRVVCQEKDEALVRTIVLRHVNNYKMMVQGISTHDEQSGCGVVVADIYSLDQQDRALQEIMSRLNIEPSVKSVHWEKT